MISVSILSTCFLVHFMVRIMYTIAIEILPMIKNMYVSKLRVLWIKCAYVRAPDVTTRLTINMQVTPLLLRVATVYNYNWEAIVYKD